MTYAFQGNAYQIGQYYESPLYVFQGGAFQYGQYIDAAAGPTNYTLTSDFGTITFTGGTATLDYVPGGPVAYSLTADAGAIRFVGASASLDLVTTAAPTVGGRSRGHKPLRVRRKHYVEIDGVLYEVGGQREADEILAKLHEQAMRRARKVATKRAPQERQARALAEIVAPQITVREPERPEPFGAVLREQVDAVNAAIAATYAQIQASAAEWLRQEEDDEDVAVLLTMGIL